jgi:nucleotide-binding universal stress UspA family protein
MIKTIAVHLTGSAEDAVRLAQAERLAERFGAHLTGVFVAPWQVYAFTPQFDGATAIAELVEIAAVEADTAFQRVEERTRNVGVRFDLRRIDGEMGGAARLLSSEARTADLFVGTRPYGDPNRQGLIEETVVFQSGRGSLLLPPGQTRLCAFENGLVAWKDTRESAHAIAESLPFLKGARQVAIVVVEECSSEERRSEPGGAVAALLNRHGIKADVRIVSGWSNAGEAVLHEATQVGADFVVAGAYSHSRLRESILGGVTRHLFSSADVPLLVAH